MSLWFNLIWFRPVFFFWFGSVWFGFVSFGLILINMVWFGLVGFQFSDSECLHFCFFATAEETALRGIPVFVLELEALRLLQMFSIFPLIAQPNTLPVS